MLFQSLEFFIFFLVTATCYFLYAPRHRTLLLLFASYYFYMSWDFRFGSLILISTIIDYIAGIIIEDTPQHTRKKKVALVISLATNLGILATFKYLNFFIDSFYDLLTVFGNTSTHTEIHIVLPVGISFFTFQSMSHTIDVYRGSLKAERDFTRFALFVAFFPQLVAGPIVRASEFLPQLGHTFKFNWVRTVWGIEKFLVGLVKKLVIADNMSPLVDSVYANPGNFGSSMLWVATLCYAIQIYADFSGYSDMAIGTARILGFKLPENFNMPYLSRTPSEFWTRWHMTLSRWLRDYLYIPLGGNRGGSLFTYRNLMLTMLLGGLWHGASYNFILWGAGHGALLCIYRLAQPTIKSLKKYDNAFFYLSSSALMFLFTLLLWVPFRAATLADTMTVWKGMFGIANFDSLGVELNGIDFETLHIAISVVLAAHLLGAWKPHWSKLAMGGFWRRSVGTAGLIFFVIQFRYSGVAPFVYFQF